MSGLVALSTMMAVARIVAADPAVQPPSRCPSIFGHDADRAQNRARREERVERVESSAGYAVIVHTGDWIDARPLWLDGVTLLAADPSSGSAKLEVSIDGVCEGTFEIAADFDLGTNTHVVAVIEEGVLVEREDELRYLAMPDTQIVIDVVWSSSFTMGSQTRAASTPIKPVPARAR